MDATDIPYKFQYVWAVAASGSYLTNPIPPTSSSPAASQQLGWPPATASPSGTPPNINDFNGIFQYLAAWARWQQAGGPVNYDATFSSNFGGYPKGAFLLAADGDNFWLSTSDNNTTDPDTGGSGWEQVSLNPSFPLGTQNAFSSLSITSSVYSGSLVYVAASGTTQTVPKSAWLQNQSVGFSAGFAFTLTLSGGSIFLGGGALNGLSSVSMPLGSFIGMVFDGANWRVFNLSPDLYV